MSHTKPLHLGYDCDCDHVRDGEEEGLPLEPLEHVPNLLNVARRFGYLAQLNSHHLILGAL